MAGVIKLAIVGEAKKFQEALGDAEKGVDRFSSLIDGLKVGFLAAGAAAGAALTKGFLDGMEAEKSASKMAASLGLSNEEAKAYGKVASELYAGAWGESLAEVQSVVGDVGRTLKDALGPGEDALKNISANVLDMAAAFEIDATRAINSAGILFTSGIAKDASHAVDLMTAALQRVPTHLREDLLDATDEYSKFFHGLGFTAEETFGMLVKASEDGMYGIDKTGDAIKEFGIRASDGSKATIEALDKVTYGAAQDFMDAFAMGGPIAREAFDDVVKGLLAIEDPADRANTAIALFGTPIEDLGTQDIPEFLESLLDMDQSFADVEGAADNMGSVLKDNLATQIESLKRRGFQALSEFVMGTVIPVVRDELIPRLQDLGDKVRAVATWVMEHKEVMIGLAAGIGAIVVPVIVALIVQLGALALSWIIAFGPIVAVGALIAGLVAGILWLYNNIEWFRTAVQVAINLVTGYFKLWWEMVQTYIGFVVATVKTVVDAVIWVYQNLGGWVDSIVGFFKDLPGKIRDAFVGLSSIITAPFRSAFNSIARLWNNTVGSLSFSVPGWVPGIGGHGWDVPDIPTFASGGFVSKPTLAIVGDTPASQGGEHMVGDKKLRETVQEAVGGAGISIGVLQVGSVNDAARMRAELDWLYRIGGK